MGPKRSLHTELLELTYTLSCSVHAPGSDHAFVTHNSPCHFRVNIAAEHCLPLYMGLLRHTLTQAQLHHEGDAYHAWLQRAIWTL